MADLTSSLPTLEEFYELAEASGRDIESDRSNYEQVLAYLEEINRMADGTSSIEDEYDSLKFRISFNVKLRNLGKDYPDEFWDHFAEVVVPSEQELFLEGVREILGNDATFGFTGRSGGHFVIEYTTDSLDHMDLQYELPLVAKFLSGCVQVGTLIKDWFANLSTFVDDEYAAWAS